MRQSDFLVQYHSAAFIRSSLASRTDAASPAGRRVTVRDVSANARVVHSGAYNKRLSHCQAWDMRIHTWYDDDGVLAGLTSPGE